MAKLALIAAAIAAAAAGVNAASTKFELTMKNKKMPVSDHDTKWATRRVDGSAAAEMAAKYGRAELIDYNPVANPSAVVVATDGKARFTVLTPRLIRMEQMGNATKFEDRATLAILNRNLPVPAFTQNTANNVLTIQTSEVKLTYNLNTPFQTGNPTVVSLNASSAFTSWTFGQAFPGNLLGTIRGLDQQSQTSLNCTVNAGVDDNGEYNHCEWGIPSRDGWTVYEDAINYCLDDNDWWSQDGAPRACAGAAVGTDAVNPQRSANYPNGLAVTDQGGCCAACLSDVTCTSWVYDTQADSPNCWPLSGVNGETPAANRVFGSMTTPDANVDTHDLYGFFHGHDYYGAIYDFTLISGKTIMVPKFASGVWWSRWFDINNYDTRKIVQDYESRGIPLDVFVIDMDWHTKDNWSGFTFDQHLFPFPADSMGYLKARGLAITLNIHDASGVNNWEALFPALVSYLGLPNSSTVVPFNLLNSTVAYGVEDIILGDLNYNKHIDFWWIDWQQGGDAGGMTGYKQNPTIMLDKIRCTDRHRNGDATRAMVLGRWGGLGGHRYQVGFSGDVGALTWDNMAYQPYFSATAANVGHGFWSHDIEGPANNMEMYTRWIQIGAFAGVMRSHDRGMSGGGCANDGTFDCSIVEPWQVPNANFEANRLALRLREELLPYIYTGHRNAFDTGVGLIRPMYYDWPEAANAYAMDGNGGEGSPITQYMFGPSVLFSPVTNPGTVFTPGGYISTSYTLASKTTWLPGGVTWYDTITGVLTAVPPANDAYTTTKNYSISEIPMWYNAAAVIPYLPLRSIGSIVGVGARQYSYLGFKTVYSGAASGSTSVYEDDGATTAYLTDNAFAWTTAAYTTSGNTMTFTINTNGAYPELPTSRNYQIKLLNGAAPSSVTVNGSPVSFVRYGASVTAPTSNQWYYDFEIGYGMGPVIDVVNAAVSSSSTVTIAITFAVPTATPAQMSGVYGAISRAIAGKLNIDLDRSTPGSNSDAPAYISVLASAGDALCYLAGNDAATFYSTVVSVPGLLGNATMEVSTTDKGSPRIPYTLALLADAMM